MGLIVLTIGCAIVMVTVSLGVGWPPFLLPAKTAKPVLEVPKTPVAVLQARPRRVELLASYTGMVRPFERYTLGFETGGRLEAFGTNDKGKLLDQGDRVAAGQVLARLDQRLLVAQLKESKARLEQAQTDMNRANELRAKNQRIITDAEFQNNVTQLQLAEAGLAITEKRLSDATLISPVNGKISKRKANPGESVNANQAILEVVQIDKVLLVLGVPESQIQAIAPGQPVHVELLARDKFGQPISGTDGTIYRVGETADDKTGLFEVEVLVDNADDRLRPGLVATGHIVVETLNAFALPMSCAIQRDGKMFIYTINAQGLAKSLELPRWIEQGREIIVPELPTEHRQVVVRGQHRLIDGRAVLVSPATPSDEPVLQADLRTEPAETVSPGT